MDTVDTLINKVASTIIYPILGVMFAVAFFMFMWGMFQYMLALSKGEKVEQGKSHMLWGTIGMVIMVSTYGIVKLIDSTIQASAGTPAANSQQLNSSIQNIQLR